MYAAGFAVAPLLTPGGPPGIGGPPGPPPVAAALSACPPGPTSRAALGLAFVGPFRRRGPAAAAP